jgi:spore germination cell wall hydrolase CwlJ-like protein
VDSSDEDFVVAMDVAEKAVADLLSDPTHDADSYANLSVSHPRWADAAKQTAIIGHHTFFRLET